MLTEAMGSLSSVGSPVTTGIRAPRGRGVVEQQQRAGSGLHRQGHGVLHGAVPVVDSHRPLAFHELRVVHQHVDAAQHLPQLRGHPGGRRVVGQADDGRPVPLDPVGQRPAALVGGVDRRDGEAFDHAGALR